MRTIWKYELCRTGDMKGIKKIVLPPAAIARWVGKQKVGEEEALCIWIELNDNDSFHEERTYWIVPTGGRVPIWRQDNYIGTIHLLGDRFIIHIYEE